MFNPFWDALAAPLGVLSDDGRALALDADVSWRELPLPLVYPHQNEVLVVGLVTGIQVVHPASGVDAAILAQGSWLSTVPPQVLDDVDAGVLQPALNSADLESHQGALADPGTLSRLYPLPTGAPPWDMAATGLPVPDWTPPPEHVCLVTAMRIDALYLVPRSAFSGSWIHSVAMA